MLVKAGPTASRCWSACLAARATTRSARSSVGQRRRASCDDHRPARETAPLAELGLRTDAVEIAQTRERPHALVVSKQVLGYHASMRDAVQPDLNSFTLVFRGRSYGDFEVGQTIEHSAGRTITMADNLLFCTALCWWRPVYVDEPSAQAEGHPTTPINPMLLVCIAVGLSVEDLSEGGGPFLGVDDVQFLRAVYPNDTIRSSSVVKSKRLSRSHPDMGVVTWRTVASNQHGDEVVRLTRTNLVSVEG